MSQFIDDLKTKIGEAPSVSEKIAAMLREIAAELRAQVPMSGIAVDLAEHSGGLALAITGDTPVAVELPGDAAAERAREAEHQRQRDVMAANVGEVGEVSRRDELRAMPVRSADQDAELARLEAPDSTV